MHNYPACKELMQHQTQQQQMTSKIFYLTLSTLGKIFSIQHFKIFLSYFSRKTGFDISYKLSPLEAICMKCLSLFSGKNMKYMFLITLSSAELAQSEVKVNTI